jgi:hypothetical protein
MQVIGHLAFGAGAAKGVANLQGRAARLWGVLLPALLGCLTPDILDKAVFALQGSRYGRTIGHSLFLLAGITICWALLRAAESRTFGTVVGFFALGMATHLVGDLANDALTGLITGGQTFYTFFLWPFTDPYAWVVRNPDPLGLWPWQPTPFEVGVVIVASVGLIVFPLRKVVVFTLTDWVLLGKAVMCLTQFRMMALIDRAGVSHYVHRFSQVEPPIYGLGRAPPRQWAQAVQRAGKLVPGATCLLQALTLCFLLSEEGQNALLRIGVSRTDQLNAHAWVEKDSRVLFDPTGIRNDFTPLERGLRPEGATQP